MIANKKNRERHFLDEFASIYPAFPTGIIIESESPDFLIEQDTKVIGIEIVDYVRGQNKKKSTKRSNEVLQSKIAIEAKEKFELKYNIPLRVNFFQNEEFDFCQSDVSTLADCVVSTIEKRIPKSLDEIIEIRC